MIKKKQIKEELKSLDSLKGLIRAYEQIASTRMKKTRESVLFTRQYTDSIYQIFNEVRFAYKDSAKKFLRKRSGNKLTFLAHNGKKVAVLLSANTGLYGEIVRSTFDKFAEEIRSTDSEATIVGRQGLSLYIQTFPERPYSFFEIPDQNITLKDLTPLIKHIVQYEEIHVYHGKFISVVSQKADMLTVSAQIDLAGSTDQKPQKSYLFEPSLENILMFFETEIFASVFEQAVRESELAKYASRVLAMDKADLNIQNRTKSLELEKMRVEHIVSNKKQLNSLSVIVSLGS